VSLQGFDWTAGMPDLNDDMEMIKFGSLMTAFLRRNSVYIILVGIAVLGFWQVSFLTCSLKWDLLDVVFPFRYHFSECLRSGNFPFWNPYQQTGTPFFADLQVPFYYPELLYTSLFTGYRVYTMHLFFIAYLGIASAGMYKLSFHFNKNRVASLIAGIAYLFSGYIVAHGQHFFLLVGSAWLPYVILYYIRLHENLKLIDTVKTAVFIFLMLSGAYQTLSITLFYLLCILFIYYFIKALSQKRIRDLLRILKLNLYLALIVLALSLPLILAILEIMPGVDRLHTGIDLNSQGEFGQSLKSLISFFLPFSTLKNSDFFGAADISMINHYIGIIPLIFLLPGFLYKRSVIEYLLLGFGIFILAASFSILPVSEFMSRYLPLMNQVKYPAYNRVFGLMAMIIFTTNYIAYFQHKLHKEKNKILISAIVVLLVLISLFTVSADRTSGADFAGLSHKSLKELFNTLTFHQHIIIQALLQVIVVTLFILLIIFHKRVKHPFYLMVLLFGFEIFTATQLNMSTTVVDISHKPGRMQKDLSLYPDKFPIPVNGKIMYNDEQHSSFAPFWRNTYIFSKQISFESFSSFELKSYSKLDDEFDNLCKAVLNNHLLYFSDSILPVSKLVDSAIDHQTYSHCLFVSERDYQQLSEHTIAGNSDDEINILEFLPNSVTIETSTRHDQFLTMLQTNYKGWRAYIDNSSTPIYTSNFNYRTVFLPKGNHTVRFEYRNNLILLSYIASNIIFVFCILFLLGNLLYRRNIPKLFSGAILFFLMLLPMLFLYIRLISDNDNVDVHQRYKERWSDKTAVFHYRQDFSDIPSKEGKRVSSGTTYQPVISISNNREELKSGTLVFTAKVFPESYKEALIVCEVRNDNAIKDWHASKLNRQIEATHQWNDILYYKNLYELEENDVINVYIWNLKNADFLIDSLMVEIYPQR